MLLGAAFSATWDRGEGIEGACALMSWLCLNVLKLHGFKVCVCVFPMILPIMAKIQSLMLGGKESLKPARRIARRKRSSTQKLCRRAVNVGIMGFKDRAMTRRTQHMKSNGESQRKAYVPQQPAGHKGLSMVTADTDRKTCLAGRNRTWGRNKWLGPEVFLHQPSIFSAVCRLVVADFTGLVTSNRIPHDWASATLNKMQPDGS